MSQIAAADIERAEREATSEHWASSVETYWRHILAHFGADRDPATVTYDDAEAFVGARRKAGDRGQTIRRYRQAFTRGCEIAHRRGWIDKLPPKWPRIRGDAPLREQAGKWHPLPIVEAWLAELAPHARDEVLFALLTGLRKTELSRVRPEWVEAAPPGLPCAAILRVPAAAAKTRTERTIPLSPRALDIIQRRGRMSGKSHRTTMAAACRRIGYDQVITLRDLRHIAATIAEQRDRKATQDLMGHTTERMTSRYLHSDLPRLAAVSDAIDAALGGTIDGSQQASESANSVGGRREFRTPDVQLVRQEPNSTDAISRHIDSRLEHQDAGSDTELSAQHGGTVSDALRIGAPPICVLAPDVEEVER